MQSIIQKITLAALIILCLLGCSQPIVQQNSDNPFNLSKQQLEAPQSKATSRTVVAEEGKFEILTADVLEEKVVITAGSTVDKNSIALFMRFKVMDAAGNSLTEGYNDYVMKQGFTWGKRMYMTFEIPRPAPGMITIEGLEDINISGIVYRNFTGLEIEVPGKEKPQVTAINIDVTQDKKPGYWDGDLEAEGFVTLDRPADITGKLYALDSNGIQLPNQVVQFDIKGHQTGKLTGLYNIIHNDRPVTAVLEVYYNGALLATKRVTKAPIVNPKVLAVNLDVLHEFQNGKWDGDFEAEGFITLDRPTDITGELYAMDINRNRLPGQYTQFAINGHQAGKLTGLYHIIHNNRPVICVLKVYNNGLLIAEKEVVKYPRT